MTSQRVLHVEVEATPSLDGFGRIDAIGEEVKAWLPERFSHLNLGRKIEVLDGLPCRTRVLQIYVASVWPPQVDSVFVRIQDVCLEVHVYEIDEVLELPDSIAGSEAEGEESIEDKLSFSKLPNAVLTKAWSSIHYDEPIQDRLLHFATRLLRIELTTNSSDSMFDVNKLILLYGPPGSGKTSLSRALANRLAIRMTNDFSSAWLAEVNANSLHSKMFGESGKLVAKLFSRIQQLAADTATLVCVIIDEVEGLAGSRKRAISTNDVGDTVRATNELLTALDQLRHCPNVMIICTTNLPRTIDAAFLDRVCKQQFMGQPSADGAYEILRSKLNAFISTGAVVYAQEEPSTLSGSGSALHPDTEEQLRGLRAIEAGASDRFPDVVQVRQSFLHRDGLPPCRLHAIARKCLRMSGRRMSRLPFLAFAELTCSWPCPVDELLSAMDSMAEQEAEEDKAGKVY